MQISFLLPPTSIREECASIAALLPLIVLKMLLQSASIPPENCSKRQRYTDAFRFVFAFMHKDEALPIIIMLE